MARNKMTSLTGNIKTLVMSETQYGLRTQATIERVDWSTGEVFTHIAVAWGDIAKQFFYYGRGIDVGLSGAWKDSAKGQKIFNVQAVSEVRIIDPRTIDVSKYL